MLHIQSSAEGDLQAPTHPIVCKRAQLKQAHQITDHQHPRGQLLFSTHSALQVQVGQHNWYLPAQEAVWIPSNLSHQIDAPQGAEYHSVYTDQTSHKNLPKSLQKQPGLVVLSPLFRHLIYQSEDFASDYQTDSAEARLNQVLFDQLQQLQFDSVNLPMPSSPILLRLCQHQLAQPEQRLSLQDWGHQYGATERHLARKFKQETGLTFGQWRHRHHVTYALEQLQQGFSISHIAADLGYAHSNTFSQMVKKTTGLSPSQLAQQRLSA